MSNAFTRPPAHFGVGWLRPLAYNLAPVITNVSIAVETSSRAGGLALGIDRRLRKTADFQAAARHATQLVGQMDRLLNDAGLAPKDLTEVYVSAGPGSFTGLRVGVTVARTLGQVIAGLRCVAVPTPLAVAENAADLDWQRLGVVMDARAGCVHATLFHREQGRIAILTEPMVCSPAEFLRRCGRPILLIGEGLGYHDLTGKGVRMAFPDQPDRHVPTVEAVWNAGSQLAKEGQFSDYRLLLPIYAREPEAVRLWPQQQHRPDGRPAARKT